LTHFVPGGKVLDFLAPESDWLDIRWCADADDTGFYRELPEAAQAASDIVSLHLPLTPTRVTCWAPTQWP
jgi:hypothetical protein